MWDGTHDSPAAARQSWPVSLDFLVEIGVDRIKDHSWAYIVSTLIDYNTLLFSWLSPIPFTYLFPS
jgi:hypothetical protein